METILTDLYEALGRLRYPEIAQVDRKDLPSTVLAAQSRVSLLSWLLARASPALAAHLEKFKDSGLEAEIVKLYSEMGICSNEKLLLGNCSIKQQLPILKALLVFINCMDDSDSEATKVDESVISEILEEQIAEDINIIPAGCNVSAKLKPSEAITYFEEIKKNVAEVETSAVPAMSPSSEPTTGIEVAQVLSLDLVIAKFTAAFQSISSWSNPKSPPPTVKSNYMDQTVETMYTNFCTLNQVLRSNKSISELTVPKGLDKIDTILSPIIEDNVICTEEVQSLYNANCNESVFEFQKL